jgi:hypothetical protein
VITFHLSEDGGTDYLDLHTPEGDRLYLPRHEARKLAQTILAAEDVVCGHCGMRNGAHRIWADGRRCEASASASWSRSQSTSRR